MLHNYHTHTVRCNHAVGTDREYVENAIAAGLKTLGFSDHAPQAFPQTDVRYSHCMRDDQLFEYAESVRALAKEYENDIRILCGFELEYFPDSHEEETAFLRQVRPDYLIMGQHYLGNGIGKKHVYYLGREGDDAVLEAYVSQMLAGLATGDFLYVAHPDIAGFAFSEQACEREYRRLCAYAKRKNIPLELNLLGVKDNRLYPDRRFYKIAAEVGNEVVLGVDAHEAKVFSNPEPERKARTMAAELGLSLRETPLL
ncbi:MAG: histidinol-phosphatase [Clostridia bacterium]|nr:histidinol-phosphatase [Clostridia bacterium]